MNTEMLKMKGVWAEKGKQYKKNSRTSEYSGFLFLHFKHIIYSYYYYK